MCNNLLCDWNYDRDCVSFKALTTGCVLHMPNSKPEAKPVYPLVSVERLVSRRVCANGVQAETEGNAPISREAPQERAANTSRDARREGEKDNG